MLTLNQQQNVLTRVLFVDLDGTLVATDLLGETLIEAIKHNPCVVFKIFRWVCRGRSRLKKAVAEGFGIDPKRLPYRADVLHFLQTQRSLGWVMSGRWWKKEKGVIIRGS